MALFKVTTKKLLVSNGKRLEAVMQRNTVPTI